MKKVISILTLVFCMQILVSAQTTTYKVFPEAEPTSIFYEYYSKDGFKWSWLHHAKAFEGPGQFTVFGRRNLNHPNQDAAGAGLMAIEIYHPGTDKQWLQMISNEDAQSYFDNGLMLLSIRFADRSQASIGFSKLEDGTLFVSIFCIDSGKLMVNEGVLPVEFEEFFTRVLRNGIKRSVSVPN